MRIDISQKIGVCYRDEDWGKEVLEQIYSQTPKNMIYSKRKNRIDFIDGSCVVAFPDTDSARGRKLDKVFIQSGVDEQFIDIVLKPQILNNNIMYEQYVTEYETGKRAGESYFWRLR